MNPGLTFESKSPDQPCTVAKCARLSPNNRESGCVACEKTDFDVASVTARLLAIADKGQADGTGPTLSVARAALMDAARLNGLTAAAQKPSGPTLEDMLAQIAQAEEPEGANEPGDGEAAEG